MSKRTESNNVDARNLAQIFLLLLSVIFPHLDTFFPFSARLIFVSTAEKIEIDTFSLFCWLILLPQMNIRWEFHAKYLSCEDRLGTLRKINFFAKFLWSRLRYFKFTVLEASSPCLWWISNNLNKRLENYFISRLLLHHIKQILPSVDDAHRCVLVWESSINSQVSIFTFHYSPFYFSPNA